MVNNPSRVARNLLLVLIFIMAFGNTAPVPASALQIDVPLKSSPGSGGRRIHQPADV